MPDGEPVQRLAIERLKALGRPSRPLDCQRHDRSSGWTLWPAASGAIRAVALSQCVVAIAAAISGGIEAPSSLSPVYPHILVGTAFLLPACLLLLAPRRNRRVTGFGDFLLVAGAAFADAVTRSWAGTHPGLAAVLAGHVTGLATDAFLPALLFTFVCDFPRVAAFVRPQLITGVFARIAWPIGLVLFLANLPGLDEGVPALSPLVSLLDRDQPLRSWYWRIVCSLLVAGLLLAASKARQARGDDRVRTQRLLAVVALGATPVTVATLASGFEWPVQMWLVSNRAAVGLVVYSGLMTIPLFSAHVVYAERLVEFRPALLYRAASLSVRFVLASSTLGPFAVTALRLYMHRTLPLVGALAAAIPAWLAAWLVAATVLLRFRLAVLRYTDEWLLNERRDVLRSVQGILEAVGTSRTSSRIVAAVVGEVQRSLNARRAHGLRSDPTTQGFLPVAPSTIRRLTAPCGIVAIVAETRMPVSLELDEPSSVARLLPESERQWLMDTGCRLVMGWQAGDRVAGLLALESKNTDLGYTAADRRFLRGLMRAVQPLFDSMDDPSTVSPTDDCDAVECRQCGTVYPGGSVCRCGGTVSLAPVPVLLAGKFQIERKIGQGGMGVVYRALDTQLGRIVAIKTLPRAGTSASLQLRHEARVMATLSHPHVAQILGLETWRGVPMIVVEYLAGGTLAGVLASGLLPPERAVAIVAAVAGTLCDLHKIGLVHRDIKPSNIGFAADGTPKLLDFGVADLLLKVEWDREAASSQRQSASEPTRCTPAYLPPEATRGAAPAPSWDLWSLAIVLYEALSGTNPLRGSHDSATLAAVRSGIIPDIRRFTPDCPTGLAEFLAKALSLAPARRPRSAADFKSDLVRTLPAGRLN